MPSKSYWGGVYIGDARSQEAVKSWFGPMAEGLTIYKAEILCEIATDREKKMRAFMKNADNKHFRLERTLGGATFSISRKAITTPTSGRSTAEPRQSDDEGRDDVKRWPIIRHIRFFYLRFRVNQHYDRWRSVGMLPVHAHHDYAVLDKIWAGEE